MVPAPYRSWFWHVVHNCVAHPLLVILPEELGERFHEWTEHKAY